MVRRKHLQLEYTLLYICMHIILYIQYTVYWKNIVYILYNISEQKILYPYQSQVYIIDKNALNSNTLLHNRRLKTLLQKGNKKTAK